MPITTRTRIRRLDDRSRWLFSCYSWNFCGECLLSVFVYLRSYLCVVAIFLSSCVAVKQVLSSIRRELHSTCHFGACIPPQELRSMIAGKYTFLGTATAGRLGRLGSEVTLGTIRIRVVHVVAVSSARAPSAATARFTLRLGLRLGRLVRRPSVVTAAVIVILVVVSADQLLFVVVARARTVAGAFRGPVALLAVGGGVFVIRCLLAVSPEGRGMLAHHASKELQNRKTCQ